MNELFKLSVYLLVWNNNPMVVASNYKNALSLMYKLMLSRVGKDLCPIIWFCGRIGFHGTPTKWIDENSSG